MDFPCDGVPQRAIADAAMDLNATDAISSNASQFDEYGRAGLSAEPGFPILPELSASQLFRPVPQQILRLRGPFCFSMSERNVVRHGGASSGWIG